MVGSDWFGARRIQIRGGGLGYDGNVELGVPGFFVY